MYIPPERPPAAPEPRVDRSLITPPPNPGAPRRTASKADEVWRDILINVKWLTLIAGLMGLIKLGMVWF